MFSEHVLPEQWLTLSYLQVLIRLVSLDVRNGERIPTSALAEGARIPLHPLMMLTFFDAFVTGLNQLSPLPTRPRSWYIPSLFPPFLSSPSLPFPAPLPLSPPVDFPAVAPLTLLFPPTDDDGSGTTVLLSIFHALLAENFTPTTNPIEFHFYSAEEGSSSPLPFPPTRPLSFANQLVPVTKVACSVPVKFLAPMQMVGGKSERCTIPMWWLSSRRVRNLGLE